MPLLAPFHDLLVDASGVVGECPHGFDPAPCADIARGLARSAQTWASESRWTGLGGFDSSGGFWLAPLYGERLAFLRSTHCEGWLRPPDLGGDALALRFPVAARDPDGVGPLSLAGLRSRLCGLPGLGGCALRHPTTGFWNPIISAPDPARFASCIQNFAPIARILTSQRLPAGRLLLTSTRSAALAWYTPAKSCGYLQVDDLAALPAAAALVDLFLLCTALADLD